MPTAIEWTDEVWNPITGCTKVSPGCDHCYAETFAERFRGTTGHHFENGFDLTLRPEALWKPERWKKPRRVFVNSMSDLFHRDVPDEFIQRVFLHMGCTPRHTFQVLTKRPERMRRLAPSFNHWKRGLNTDTPAEGIYRLVDRDSATTTRDRGRSDLAKHDLVDRGHPGWMRVKRVGKHLSGRILDGRTWDEFPSATRA